MASLSAEPRPRDRARVASATEDFFLHSWWVVLFFLICFAAYEQGSRHLSQEYNGLLKQLHELEQEKEKALALRRDLQLQIKSQSDPNWVELTLMKGLGVVPAGQQKVLFLPPSDIEQYHQAMTRYMP